MGVLAVDSIVGNPTVVGVAPNATVQQQLQNNYAMEHLHFRMTGTLTLASYTANPAKYVESLENLISSIQLQATGNTANATSNQLCNVDAAFLAFKTRLMEGTAPFRTDVGTSNGAYAFETNFKRYFVDPRSNRGSLFRLFTSYLSSLNATYYFRDPSAMVYGGTGGTATMSGVQITVQARQYLGLNPPNPSPWVRETQRTTSITQQTNGLDLNRVPVGNILRRQYFKGMVGAVPYADPSDAIFAATGKPEGPHVALRLNNTITVLDQVYAQMRADDKTLFGIEALPTGYAVFEPARNGALVNSIPMGNVANADNLIDVGYTAGSINTLQVTDEELMRVSSAQYVS